MRTVINGIVLTVIFMQNRKRKSIKSRERPHILFLHCVFAVMPLSRVTPLLLRTSHQILFDNCYYLCYKWLCLCELHRKIINSIKNKFGRIVFERERERCCDTGTANKICASECKCGRYAVTNSMYDRVGCSIGSWWHSVGCFFHLLLLLVAVFLFCLNKCASHGSCIIQS